MGSEIYDTESMDNKRKNKLNVINIKNSCASKKWKNKLKLLCCQGYHQENEKAIHKMEKYNCKSYIW